MLKSTILWSVAMCAVSFGTLAQARAAESESTVLGKVGFERRSTIIPMAICERQPCPVSKPYWSMVLQSEDGKYELDQMFALGSSAAPESVQVTGVVIRPGTRVALVGQVESISRDYAIISQVKSATVVMDIETVDSFTLAEPVFESEDYPRFYGWSCQSKDGVVPGVYAEVLYSGQEGGPAGPHDSYRLRVTATKSGEDLSVYPLALVENAILSVRQNDLVYSGQTADASVELSIQGNRRDYFDLPATVRISPKVADITTPGSEGKSYDLHCSRTRIYPY